MTVNNNSEAILGGGVYTGDNSTVTFEGNSIATANNNEAERGGGIYINSFTVIFKGNSSVIIYNNQVEYFG